MSQRHRDRKMQKRKTYGTEDIETEIGRPMKSERNTVSQSHRATVTWSQRYIDTEKLRLGDRKKKKKREGEIEKMGLGETKTDQERQRDGGRARQRETKTDEAKKDIKTAGVRKADDRRVSWSPVSPA